MNSYDIHKYLIEQGYTEHYDTSLYTKYWSEDHTVQMYRDDIIIDSVQRDVKSIEELKKYLNVEDTK